MSLKTWRIEIFVIPLSLSILLSISEGQAPIRVKKSVDPHLECISRLRLPMYGPIAESSRGGTVDAIILLGPTGKPQSLELQATDSKLKGEVSLAIADSEFNANCAGQAVSVRFVFKDMGQRPGGLGVWQTYLIPPNSFEITGTHPPPSFDPGRSLERQ